MRLIQSAMLSPARPSTAISVPGDVTATRCTAWVAARKGGPLSAASA